MKEHISKGERKRRNQAEKYRLLEVFHQTLLGQTDAQIASIVRGWMTSLSLLGEDENVDGPLEEICELLGFRVVIDGIDSFTYTDYKDWRDGPSEENSCYALEFKLDDLTGLRQRIEGLSLKDLEKVLLSTAFQAEYMEPESEGLPRPPLFPKFIEHVTTSLAQESLAAAII